MGNCVFGTGSTILAEREETLPRPVSSYRMSAGAGVGVWKVRLVISPEELAEILSQETKTEAFIESVRAVANCRNSGVGSGANSPANSDQWSVRSSRKRYLV